MRSPSALRLACIAGLMLVGACSDPVTPAPAVDDDLATLDMAVSAGDAIAADVGFLIDGEFGGMRMVGPLPPPPPGGDRPALDCSIADDGRHVCTGTGPGGLSITQSFAFFDAANAIQRTFDPVTTASINFQLAVSGTVSRDGHTATITRNRNHTLSGLAGEETQRTWNGTGTGSHNGSATGPRGTRTYVMVEQDTTTNVVFALPRDVNRWPVSGSIVHRMSSTATMDGDRSGTRTINRRAVVTFNGTADVTLQIGDHTCALNLETRAVTCPDRPSRGT